MSSTFDDIEKCRNAFREHYITKSFEQPLTMFFFFMGGLEPTIGRKIASSVAPCLHCQGSMDLVEAGKTLTLFFIPVWTFAPKEQLHCSRCSFLTDADTSDALKNRMYPSGDLTISRGQRNLETLSPHTCCSKCGASMTPSWKFCPACGKSLGVP